MRPELIIFDCDGVLIDSEIISAKTLMELLEPFGVHVDLDHIRQHFIGRSFPIVAALIRSQFELDLPDYFEAEYRSVLLEKFDGQLQTTKGVVDILENLSVRYCVATSSSPERAKRSLEITRLDRFFRDHIYTASEVTHGKPAPDLFLHVAVREGADPKKCLVIEDSLPGVKAAIAADMQVLRYTGGSHFEKPDPHRAEINSSIISFDSWAKFFDIVPSIR